MLGLPCSVVSNEKVSPCGFLLQLPEEVYTEMAAGAERMRAQYEAAVQEGDREELEVLHEELRVGEQ
jgi:hypothetical protein